MASSQGKETMAIKKLTKSNLVGTEDVAKVSSAIEVWVWSWVWSSLNRQP